MAKYLKTNSLLIINGSTCGPTKIAKPTVFQVVLRGIGKSFQSAITAPRINLTGYGNATAQSYRSCVIKDVFKQQVLTSLWDAVTFHQTFVNL